MKLAQILLERPLAQFQDEVTVKVDIKADMTAHADERQYRHDDSAITDAEIAAVVDKALPKVVQMYWDGKLTNKDTIVITSPADRWLNVVCKYVQLKGTDQLDIITVMRERDFHAKPGDKTIRV